MTAKSPDAHIACCLALIDDAGCAGRSSSLACSRPADAGEMVVAVPDRVIFEDELARQRRIAVERHGQSRSSCSSVSARIAAAAAALLRCSRSIAASFVTAALSTACLAFISSTSSIVTPVTACPWPTALRQLDFDRIDARDVMHDDADRSAVVGHPRLPFLGREAGAKAMSARAPCSRRSARALACPVDRRVAVSVTVDVFVMQRNVSTTPPRRLRRIRSFCRGLEKWPVRASSGSA